MPTSHIRALYGYKSIVSPVISTGIAVWEDSLANLSSSVAEWYRPHVLCVGREAPCGQPSPHMTYGVNNALHHPSIIS